MKKVFLVVGLALASMAINAQVFIGGSLNFSTDTDKPEVGDKTTTTVFGIAPEVGFSLSEKFDVGLGFGFNSKSAKAGSAAAAKTSSWNIAPFAQYSCLEFGKFSVVGRASIFFGGAQPEASNDKIKTSAFGLNIRPVLHYDLSENFTLTANLNFLQLGFSSETTKFDGKKTQTDSNFGLGVNTGDVYNTGNIQVGFVYFF